MTPANKAKWQDRSIVKAILISHGQGDISGGNLNRLVRLPRNAVWRESNFD